MPTDLLGLSVSTVNIGEALNVTLDRCSDNIEEVE